MGTGRIYFDSGQSRYFVDLSITGRYTLPPGDLLLWEASIRKASDYLFAATKGKMQLGKIGLLPYSPTATTDDIKLTAETAEHSATYDFPNTRLPDQSSFDNLALIKLTQIAKNHPLEITHELFHYVVSLADEYVNKTQGKCTGDPGTGACIMEYAADHSVTLETDGVTVTTIPCASDEVTQLCFPANSGFAVKHNPGNYQQDVHKKSCWETLHEFYPSVPVPASPQVKTMAAPIAVDWFERQLIRRVAVVVYGTSRLQQLGLLEPLQRSLLAQIEYLAGSKTEFYLYIDGTPPLDLAFELVPESKSTRFREIQQAIVTLNNGVRESTPIYQLDPFELETVAGWQTLSLVIPDDTETEFDKTFFRDLVGRLEDQFVDLRVVTAGAGNFFLNFENLAPAGNRTSVFRNPPHVDTEVAKLRFQGSLLENMLEETPGLDFVATRTGYLPKASYVALQDKTEVKDLNPSMPALRLHPHFEGYDVPVLVEYGAKQLHVWVNQLTDVIGMEILDPKLRVVKSNLDVPAKRDLSAIGSLTFDKGLEPGRWIIRLLRRFTSAEQPPQNHPFELLVATENPDLVLFADVIQAGNQQVRIQAYVEFAATGVVDQVVATAKFYDLARYGIDVEPVASAVLSPTTQTETIPETKDEQFTSGVSTGFYQSLLQLEPGDYLGEIEVRSTGESVLANNPKKRLFESPWLMEQPLLPAFSRVKRIQVSVKPG